MGELAKTAAPAIQPFFNGPRARAAQAQAFLTPKEPSSKPK
jgi:hypothetical protein